MDFSNYPTGGTKTWQVGCDRIKIVMAHVHFYFLFLNFLLIDVIDFES